VEVFEAWEGQVHIQMRKKRKVSSVIGWLLSLQLRLPGAGVCCAFSMVSLGVGVTGS
jgi:hypothetical protein